MVQHKLISKPIPAPLEFPTSNGNNKTYIHANVKPKITIILQNKPEPQPLSSANNNYKIFTMTI